MSTVILTEGFETLPAWAATGGTLVAGRTGGNAMARAGTPNSCTYAIPSGQQDDSVYVDLWWKSTWVSGSQRTIFQLCSPAGTPAVTVETNAFGEIAAHIGGTGGILITGSIAVSVNTWYHVECHLVLADTGGLIEVKLNGTVFATFTGDTKPGASSVVESLILFGPGSVDTNTFDDLVISADLPVVITQPPDPPSTFPVVKAHRSEFAFTTTYYPVCQVQMGPQTWDALDAAHTTWDAMDIAYDDWNAQTVGWLDVSCYVHESESERGRERFTDRFDAGTATITFDNRTGWADLFGTPDDLRASPLRPARPIRIGIAGPWDLPVWNNADYPLWLYRGFIDTNRPSYDPVQEDIVTVTVIDALGEVGRSKMPAVLTPVGANETADVRIDRILTAAPWSGERLLYPSGTTLIATNLGTQVIDELGRTADSVGGVVYGDLDGGVTFKDRDWMLWATGTPEDAVIGFSPETDDDVCPTDWEMSFDRLQLTTQAELARAVDPSVGGAPAEVPTIYTDAQALDDYGSEVFSRTDLLCTDPATMFPLLANRWLAIRGITSMPRIEAVTLNASNANSSPFITWGDVVATYATWTAVLATVPTWGTFPVGTPAEPIHTMATCMPEEPSRYRCRLKTHSGRLVFDRQMFATNVRHVVNRNEWVLRIALDAAEWAET